jgi:hypothetical protein
VKASFLRGAAIGGIAGVLGAGATVALAGSGVGAVFNLGKTNTVDAQSTLTGNAGANPQLKVQNTGTGGALKALSSSGEAVYGQSSNGPGLRGTSNAGVGVVGTSRSGYGVYAISTNNDGVDGLSESPNFRGVYGSNDAGGTGVAASAVGNGTAVEGHAKSGRGVAGFSQSFQGVYGSSVNQAGVVGDSSGFDGVFGVTHSANAAGVSGHAPNGGWGLWGSGKIGVFGAATGGGGYAMQANGNATQDRPSGGWIKAMALIDYRQADPIQRCFNSQLPPNSDVADCGLTATSPSLGEWRVNFGFRTDDRFVAVTVFDDHGDIGYDILPGTNQNEWKVHTFYSSVNTGGKKAEGTNAPFFIVVY